MREMKLGAESRRSLRVIFWSALAGAVLLVVLFLVVAPDRWSVGLFATIPFLIVARIVHRKQWELPEKPLD